MDSLLSSLAIFAFLLTAALIGVSVVLL